MLGTGSWGMHLVCIKYELMYSDAKSRFISATLSSAVRTLGWDEGHVVGLMVAWSWFGQCTNLLTASWGSESPFYSILSIHESKESWGKKKTNPLVLPVGHKHLSIPALPALSLSERPHSSLCGKSSPKTTMHLSRHHVFTSPSLNLNSSACVPFFLTFWMDIPKKKLLKYSLCFTRTARMYTLNDTTLEDSMDEDNSNSF